MFKSKLINLKPHLFLNQEFNEFNEGEIFCWLKINLKSKKNLILFFTTDNCVNPHSYKIAFKKLVNINFEDINSNDIELFWKNQFLVSDLLDLFSGGWVENIPKNWKSKNNDRVFEMDINKNLIEKINIFYSNLEGGVSDLNKKKIQYLLL